MKYPLEEGIGPPELLVGRGDEFADFHQWLDGIPDKISKSRVILARRKSGKTSFVQRLFNELWSKNGQVIPFYFNILEHDIWYPKFALDYYKTFASQFISFLERKPELVWQHLTLEQIHGYGVQENLDALAQDASFMLENQDSTNGDELWQVASSAPHRYAQSFNRHFVVILDEFHNMSFHIFRDRNCQTKSIHSMPGSYNLLSESKVAPMLVTGSYVGILRQLMAQYLKGGRLSETPLSPYLDSDSGLDAVYRYARAYKVTITNRSAAHINELCMSDPFLISCVLQSRFVGKNLTTPEGVIDAVEFEFSNRISEMSRTWAEYLDMTFEKVNGPNTKALMLFLNKNNDRSWTPAELKKKLNLPLDEFEIKKRLVLLSGSDVIARDSTDIHFSGIPDGTLKEVLRHRFEEEIDGIAPDFIAESTARLQALEKDRNKWRGRANHWTGMMAERLLATKLRNKKFIRLSDYFTGGTDDSELNLIDVQERVFLRRSDTKQDETDIIAKSDDGRVLMIEVRKRQKATGIKAVKELRDNADAYAQKHGVTVLPAFFSLGGFTKEAKKFCVDNGIGIAKEIEFYD